MSNTMSKTDMEDTVESDLMPYQEQTELTSALDESADGVFHASVSGQPGTSSYWKSFRAVELVCCVGFLLITLIAFSLPILTLHQRPIPYQLLENSGDYARNQVFNEVFEGETVSTTLLLVLSCAAPLLIQLVVSFYGGRHGDVHATVCVYCVAMGVNLIVTDVLKHYVGYLRPIFYDWCEPNDDYSACTADESTSNSIRRSFPSGHSSMSLCGLSVLTLYLHTRFGTYSRIVYRPSTSTNGRPAWRKEFAGTDMTLFRARVVSILALLPLALALFIATSRLVDNKHFPADVVGGSLLGAAVANFVHGLWFV